MAKQPVDMDKKQLWKDICRPNRYALDTRFVLQDGERHPFAVICPGGGYTMVCSFTEGTPIARELNKLGISAFIVYYRVRKKAHYPHPQDDLAHAVENILAHAEEYGVDPNDYSVWGSSAGGHLAASFGTENMGFQNYHLPKPRAIVLSYPVISMDMKISHRDTHDNLLGKEATAEMEQFASIDENVSDLYPPTYLWCGDADTALDPENTRRMIAALEKAGVPSRYEIFPGVDHGVGPGTGTAAEGWIERAVEFWKEQKQ